MNTSVFGAKSYQEEVQKNKEKESELIRLLQVKAEKLANKVLSGKYHTQLSYLSPDEQAGALALPKGILLDKLLTFLRSI